MVKITDIRSEGSPDTVQDFEEISAPNASAEDIIDSISESKNIKDTDLVQLGHHRIKGDGDDS